MAKRVDAVKKIRLLAVSILCAAVAAPVVAQPGPGRGDRKDPGDFRGAARGEGNRNAVDGWTTIGTEVFDEGFGEKTLSGEGRGATSIGIRPIDNDARCRNVTVTFADGTTQVLPINANENLDAGKVHDFHLGRQRDVNRIDMACQASDGRRVRMTVLTR